jgi:tetratricopeptide (TPR) repeat protein
MPPETFWDAITNQADSSADLISIAYELHHRGRYRNAARVYLMAADAGEINGLLYLADCRRRVGDNADAETLLKIAADRGSLAAHIDLAESLHQAGDSESAKQIFKNVLINSPIDSEERSSAWGQLIDLCEDAGDITTARRWLKQAASGGDRSAADELARLDRGGDKRELMMELVKASRLVLLYHRKIERAHRRMIRLSCVDAECFSWALQHFQEMAADDERVGKGVDGLVMLGRIHSAHGNNATAKAIFLKATNALAGDYIKGAIPALVELFKLLKKARDDSAANRLWKYGLELDGSISAPWKALDQRPRASR